MFHILDLSWLKIGITNLVKSGKILHANSQHGAVTIGPYKTAFWRSRYALFVDHQVHCKDLTLLANEFIDLVGVREAVHSILKVSDLFDPPKDAICDPNGDLYFYAPQSCGYCFFHIIHSRERHELARLLVAHTLSNR